MRTIVFSCSTPYHLVNAMYYGQQIHNAKRILVWNEYANYGVDVQSLIDTYFDEVVTIPYFLKGNQIVRQLTKSKHAGRFFKLSDEYKLLNSNECDIFVIFCDQEPCCNKQMSFLCSKKNVKVLLIEEGIATYVQKDIEYNKLLILVYKLLGIKAVSRIGLNSNFDAVMVRHLDMLDKNRYQCNRYIKQNNFAYDLEFINSIPFLDSLDTYNETNKKNLLFLGQPIAEVDGISSNEYISLLKKIVCDYGDQYNIIVKPHPREDPEYYKNIPGLQIVETKWIPFEVVAAKLKFDIVMSAFSSASFNAYEIKPGIKNIYLYRLFPNLKFDDSLFKKYESMINTYIPSNYDDFKDAMNTETQKVDLQYVNSGDDLNYLNQLLSD